MKVLVTGGTGMLGSDIVKVFGKNHDVVGLSHEELDVTSREETSETVNTIKPDIVLHCAAFTDVDGCEKETEKAYRVNALGTRNVAAACEEIDSAMLYISTDYVFDGRKGRPYTEIDGVNPLSVYGASKLMGERFVMGLLRRYYIVRTSWLFGRNGKNFVKTVLRLATKSSEDEPLKIVDDQVGTPTYTKDLSEKILGLTENGFFGLYNITNSGHCSWCDFAAKILELSGINKKIIPIKSWELGRPAPRPAFSVLDNMLLSLEDLIPLRNWDEALKDYLSEELAV